MVMKQQVVADKLSTFGVRGLALSPDYSARNRQFWTLMAQIC